MKWKDFLKRSGLSPEDFKALTIEEKELLRAVYSGKKIIIVRAPARMRDLRLG